MVKKVVSYTVLVLFTVVALFPLVSMWIAAFGVPKPGNLDPFVWPDGWTLDNIRRAVEQGKMGLFSLNSILVAVPRVFFVLLLSSLAGFAFGKLRWRGRDQLFYYVLFGMMIPIQAMLIPLYFNMSSLGLVNTRLALILPYFGLSMPFSVFLMRAFFRDFPDELMDAAYMDGCNKWGTWWHILLPVLKPAMVSVLIFEFMWSWNDFLLPMIFVYDENLRTLPQGLMFFQGKYTSDQTLIASAVSISTIPIVVVYLLFQNTFTAGLTAGAVKG